MKPLSNAALSVKSSALKPHKERGRQSSSDLVVRARSVWESVVDNDSEDLLWVGVCCRYHYLVAQSVDQFLDQLQNLSLPTKRASSQTDHTRSYFSSLTNFSCKLTPYKAPGGKSTAIQDRKKY